MVASGEEQVVMAEEMMVAEAMSAMVDGGVDDGDGCGDHGGTESVVSKTMREPWTSASAPTAVSGLSPLLDCRPMTVGCARTMSLAKRPYVSGLRGQRHPNMQTSPPPKTGQPVHKGEVSGHPR